MKNNNSPVKHFFVIFSGAFISLLIGVLTTPIITRIVDPVEYGQLSIFNLYCNIAVMVFCLGMDQALVRFYYEKESLAYRQTISRKSMAISLGIWIVVAVVISILVKEKVISFEWDNKIVLCLLLFISIELMNRFSSLIIRLEYHSSKYSLRNILHKALYVGIVLILISYTKIQHLYSLVYATIISATIVLVIGIAWERKIWFGKVIGTEDDCRINLYKMIRYGVPFILSMGITTVFHGIDKMSLNYFCSYEEVGIYASAMSLINIFAVLQSSINTIWAPMATRHYESDPEDKVFYQKGNAYITILMFFAGLCLILCKDIFAILLGEKYREAAYILPCLCFNPIMYTISETTVSGINFAKKSHLHIWIALLACIVNIIGNTILVPLIGGRGAAISTGLSYIVYFAARTAFSNKYFKVDFRLKRVAILTIISFGYALYSTFVSFNWITVVLYFVSITALICLYREDIMQGLNLLVGMIRRKLRNEKER